MALPASSRLRHVPAGVPEPLLGRLLEQRARTKDALLAVEEAEEVLRRRRQVASDRLATYEAMLLEVQGQGVLELEGET